mmetsp:Transcript_27004/g.59053  ORF Transcript_27004/g.59053 Transcript_27004/m.59053 type:complete len:252 (-) Transcript_27004:555-1310(-)
MLCCSYARVPDDLRLEVRGHVALQQVRVHVVPCCHLEAPLVLGLTAQVEVHVCHQQPVLVASKGRGAAAIRGRHIGAAVEVAKILVCRLAVPGCEFVGEGLSAHAVDGGHEDCVGNGGVAPLDGPQGLTEVPHGRGRVEDDLGAIESKALPVHGVVAPVADVDCNLAECSLEHGVAGVALHVVGGLVEVTDPGNVVLPVLPNNVAVVADHHCCVPHHLPMCHVTLKDGCDNHHVPLAGQLLAELNSFPSFS